MIQPLLLEGLLPSPGLLAILFIVVCGGITALLTALVFARRKLGLNFLMLAWAAESLLVTVVLDEHTPHSLLNASFILLLPTLVAHVRAVRWPDGRKKTDVALAFVALLCGVVATLWLTE